MTSTRSTLVLVLLAGCSPELHDPALDGTIVFHPDRPTLPVVERAPPYTGSDPAVREAQDRLPTGLDLHAKVIFRTCSPNGGVCHNSKEYPDLRTPASFLAALGAPCNVQPGTFQAVYDRCERSGDRFALGDGGPEREIGYLDNVPGERKGVDPPTRTTPGLHIYLAEPVAARDEVQAIGRFIRAFVGKGGNVEELPFASFATRWTVLDGGTHLLGAVPADALTRVQELMTVGIVQGDQNRNGVFGARQALPVPLLRPGKPEESYLIGRLRGVMFGGAVPGSRMPLANQPLSVPEMLALFCFVEGLGPAATAATVNLASAIDYARCSYSAAPDSLNLLGSGVTWARRVKNILEFNCAGCHSGPAPQGALDLAAASRDVYARLLLPSTERPDLPLVRPRVLADSYLWRKLTGDMIAGARMPLNPLTGQGRLPDAELADIKAWIEAGAVEDQ
jgi:hypothetical protein